MNSKPTNEAGQTTTEYGLILFLLSIGVVAVLSVIAGSVNDVFTNSEALIKEAIDKVMA